MDTKKSDLDQNDVLKEEQEVINQPVVDQEDPATYEALNKLLTERNIEFKKTTHKPVRTSEEAAEVRGVSLASGAKAMLIKLEKENVYTLLVMSAARKISWKLVRQMLGTKKLNLASPEEVKLLTKCVPGAVPPFGSLWGVRTFTDHSLLTQGDVINFNAGLRTTSFSMKTEDYKTIEKPEIKEFTE